MTGGDDLHGRRRMDRYNMQTHQQLLHQRAVIDIRASFDLVLLFQLEEVCPSVRDANRGSTMSSTSRPSTLTGTPSASGTIDETSPRTTC